MNISEKALRELIVRVLCRLEKEQLNQPKTKVYMLCLETWQPGYAAAFKEMENRADCHVVCVLPPSWKGGVQEKLKEFPACKEVLYYGEGMPKDLGQALSIFPVVPRYVLAKTALCIGDSFETRWIETCIREGGELFFLQSGLEKFSGKETAAYQNTVLGYCRQALAYGIHICPLEEIWQAAPRQNQGPEAPVEKPEKKRRVITSSNVEKLAREGVLSLWPGDVVTDLAKERAKFLKIVIQ